MPYGNYAETALQLVLLFAPALAIMALVRFNTLRNSRAHPLLIALVECALFALVIALVAVTLVEGNQSGRALDLNPLVGVTGTAAFRSLFIANFVVLPMPLAVVAVGRFPRLASVHIALPFFVGVFAVIEAAQYVRGGRAASSQDIFLGATGATLAATYFGHLLRPLIGEMLRELGQPDFPAAAPRLGPVSVRRTVVTAAAVICPFAWIAMLAPPTPSATAGPVPGGASACGLPDGEWTIPDVAPPVDWVHWHGYLVPRSLSGAGPGHLGEHGANCFARTPSGALLAASWDQSLLNQAKRRSLVGFRIGQANPSTVSLALLMGRKHNRYLVANAVVQWTGGDWKVSMSWAEVSDTSPDLPAGYSQWGPTTKGA